METENRPGTAPTAPASRVPPQLQPYTFPKGGPSGNPGGRPKGLAARVRERTNNGEDLVDTCLEILKSGKSARDRLDAARLLWERGYGKAPETVLTGQLGAEDTAEAAALTRDDLTLIARTLTQAA